AEAVDFEYTALAEAPRNGVADGDDANHRAAVPAACAEAPSGRRITVGVVPVDKCPRRCKGNGPEFQFPVQYHPATAIVRQAAEFVTGDLLNSDMPKERTSPGRIISHLARNGFVHSFAAALQHEFMAGPHLQHVHTLRLTAEHTGRGNQARLCLPWHVTPAPGVGREMTAGHVEDAAAS